MYAKPTPPEHIHGLAAGTIKTEPYLRTQLAITDCAAANGLGVVVGDAGHGKTFAVNAALAKQKATVVSTLFSHQATPREVARQLVETATGERRSGTRFDLTDDCVDLFREPHIAVIDEAQHLNRDCTFLLRYLHDHPETRVAIILVGGNGCWERIAADPMLKSRVYRRVVFGSLPADVLLKALPKYHSIYRGVDADMILGLAEQVEISQLRTLALFTLTAATLCDELGTDSLDETVAERTVELMTGGHV